MAKTNTLWVNQISVPDVLMKITFSGNEHLKNQIDRNIDGK